MDKIKAVFNELITKISIKSKEFYNFVLLKYREKPYVVLWIWSAIFIGLIWLIVILITVPSSNNNETVEEPVEVVEVIPENPPLTDEEKIELCSKEANKMERSAYDYEWDVWTTTQFSKDEESHQLKWVTYLLNEDSLLAQCTIESGRYRDPEVRVSFLPSEYYSYDKFIVYQKHCEGLWWQLKSRWWYGHWMIWTCWFDDWTTCDLREFYRWNCSKGK